MKVLDHGYVEHIESWGHGKDGQYLKKLPSDSPNEYYDHDNEVGIVEAARQSTQGSFRGWETDKKLLAHLYNNNHDTPFEFAGMVIEVQAPIFVFREWHRHRTQSYNEMSARYAPLPDLYYTPTRSRCMLGVGSSNRQETGISSVTLQDPGSFLARLGYAYASAEDDYQKSLREGIPKELARLLMPVGHYSRMRASANLRNWLAFLTLRMDPLAQWEIRQFANAVGTIIESQFPQTWKLFEGVVKP